jgi:hypothetical protein
METERFREAAVASVDDGMWYTPFSYIVFFFFFLFYIWRLTAILAIKYFNSLEQRPVVSSVEPGYLRKILPGETPEQGEDWSSIQKDVEEKIVPGVTHW